jgi:hypothetical protein
MDKEYLHILKTSADVQPKKPKIKESKEEVLLEEAKGDTLQEELIKWFIDNPYPEDSKVHSFAEKKGIDTHKFEAEIYKILSSFLSEGKSKGKEVKHDPKELEMGMKVEMEHTTITVLARKIALDHLVEIPDYYTRLKKMEAEAGIKD